MKLTQSLELMAKYSTCPECGNQYIGNGEGTLEIDDGIFRRSCKCGWKVEIRDQIEKRVAAELEAYGNDCPHGRCEW